MKTEVINFKTDTATKKRAGKKAKKLGISLSSLLNAYLKQFIVTKRVTFSTEPEEPSEWLIESLRRSEEDEKAGRVSPAFDDVNKALAWLKDPRAKYQNGDKVQR